MREPVVEFYAVADFMAAKFPAPDVDLDLFSGPGAIDLSLCLPPGGARRLMLFIVPRETAGLLQHDAVTRFPNHKTLFCVAGRDSLGPAHLDTIFDELAPDAHYIDFSVLTPNHRAAARALNQHRAVDQQLAAGVLAAYRSGARN